MVKVKHNPTKSYETVALTMVLDTFPETREKLFISGVKDMRMSNRAVYL